jgi:hypothetical protein
LKGILRYTKPNYGGTWLCFTFFGSAFDEKEGIKTTTTSALFNCGIRRNSGGRLRFLFSTFFGFI